MRRQSGGGGGGGGAPTGPYLNIETCKTPGFTIHTALDPTHTPQNGCGLYCWQHAGGYHGNVWTIEQASSAGRYTIKATKNETKCWRTAIDPRHRPNNGCGLTLCGILAPGYDGAEWLIEIQLSGNFTIKSCKNPSKCLHTALDPRHDVSNGTIHLWDSAPGYPGAEWKIYQAG